MLTRLKILNYSLAALFVLAIILSACAVPPAAGPVDDLDPAATGTAPAETEKASPGHATAEPSQEEAMDFDAFMEALGAAGAQVQTVGEVEEPFFQVPARRVSVNGAEVQVFEFPDQAAQEAAAATISANGYIVGTSAVEWISPPYFWAGGRLIVLYVGADAALVDLLTDVLGEPLVAPQAQPEAAAATYTELVAALEAAGAQVEPVGAVEEPLFSADATRITLNGAEVQVFEFADEAAREAAAGTISANGYTIGTTAVDWVSQPYFWSNGRLIVLYVGANPSIIGFLTNALGAPIIQ